MRPNRIGRLIRAFVLLLKYCRNTPGASGVSDARESFEAGTGSALGDDERAEGPDLSQGSQKSSLRMYATTEHDTLKHALDFDFLKRLPLQRLLSFLQWHRFL